LVQKKICIKKQLHEHGNKLPNEMFKPGNGFILDRSQLNCILLYMVFVSNAYNITCVLRLDGRELKGTVQRKLTGVSGINRKLMIRHCSDGYSFFNLKGLRSLKSKNGFSALTGTLF
jgi:hypothetical protein